MAAGQVQWDSQGAGTNDYVVEFETEKNIAHEYRHRSAFGKLSKPMKTITVKAGPEQKEMDIGASAAIWSKEITSGDECRFTLEQNMSGAPTFGDAEVRVGDYLAYLHQSIILNKKDTPAVPLIEEMSRQRIKNVISSPESRIRSQLTIYLAEQYVYDALDGHFLGMSKDLSEAKSNGGRALDIGLGAGVQVSPENFCVAGSGFVSGTSGTSAYETNVETDLGGLTNTAGDMISLDFLHNIRYALNEKKIAPIEDGEKETWYAAVDPHLMARLSSVGGELWEGWKHARERAKDNPIFGHGAIELNGIVFFPEPRLKQYRPDLSSGIVWGSSNPDRRSVTTSSNIALMVIFGNGALLEGHNGQVSVTYEDGFHGKGRTIAGHIKQSFMRARWRPRDGRTGEIVQQSSLTCAFYESGLSF